VSGICALFYSAALPRDSDTHRGALRNLDLLMRGIAPRGPHGCATWAEDAILLGHCLLKEVPEAEHEAQPLQSANGRYVIVFDGRIDNREEIAASVPMHLKPERDAPDVAYVLAAIQSWEEAAAEKLLGDFAYIVWDREKRILHAARDPLAGRPLYLIRSKELVAFCSSDEALLSLGAVAAFPRYGKLLDYFCDGHHQQDPFASWYRDVEAVAPGETLIVARSMELVGRRYWRELSVVEQPIGSMGEAVEFLSDALRLAVLARLRTYGRSGMLLSGGIDSGAVLCSASALLEARGHPPIRTYSLISSVATGCVETDMIKSLARTFPCASYLVSAAELSENEMDALAAFAWTNTHPIDNDLMFQATLYRQARDDGCTSLMCGVGGDIVVDITEFPPSVWVRKLRPIRAWASAREAAERNTYLRHRSMQWILYRGTVSQAPRFLKRLAQSIRRDPLITNRARGRSVYSNELMKDFAGIEADVARARPDRIRLYDVSMKSWRSLDSVANGQIGYDRVAGRFGLVARDVWSDQRLIRAYLGIPFALRSEGGFTKSPVRALLRHANAHQVADSLYKAHVGYTVSDRLIAKRKPSFAPEWANARFGKSALRVLLDRSFGEVNNATVREAWSPARFDVFTIAAWLQRIERLNTGMESANSGAIYAPRAR
jgi:asparagine synthetase B (glutamine-hydrolysing)